MRIPLQVDIRFGDAVVPAPEEVEYPYAPEFSQPETACLKGVSAEKSEAAVQLGTANSRMKDFYDLWVPAQRFEFDSTNLAAALRETFASRPPRLCSLSQGNPHQDCVVDTNNQGRIFLLPTQMSTMPQAGQRDGSAPRASEVEWIFSTFFGSRILTS